MVPYTYNMVDMEGIDLADVADKTFPGLFNKIVDSLNACGVVILYNWYCAWLPIPPQHVDVVVVENVSVTINGMIIVNSDDTIEIPTMGGSTVLQHLFADENRIYEPPEGVDGFDLVDVQVPPAISPILINSNGTYEAPTGIDGYSPITVAVPSENTYPVEIDFTKGDFSITNVTLSSYGATFDAANSYIVLPLARAGMTLEVEISMMQLTAGTHRRFLMATSANGFIYRSTGVWSFYTGTWYDTSITDPNFFDDCIVKLYVDSDNIWHIYKDNVQIFQSSVGLSVGGFSGTAGGTIGLGSTSSSINNAIIKKVKIY